jgi:hypothetical protein
MAKRSAKNSQHIKASLRVLKAKGLYSGDLRKAPTDYGKRLARKYSDVVTGQAVVTRVAAKPTKRGTGARAARLTAKSVADAYSTQIRAKGSRLIVQVPTSGTKAVYSPKRGIVELLQPQGKDTIIRIPLKSEGVLTVQPDNTVDVQFRPLKNNEAYYVPFVGKNGGVRYTPFADIQALKLAIERYQHWGDVATNIVISKSVPKRKRRGNALEIVGA